ncbi:MAG: GNAT family N-acetyltransferase [Ignavibacteriae bacterium]|nr:GNAT family N-acetyltransferase [Ignavibacteriota bacterium]MCB9209534.1 GNAT family N-acetyltransferase [Ignavibacteriales bacterium]MCB9258177.1 GNAT family N-acetyltransferase [Ignavibacteriales bacterium]
MIKIIRTTADNPDFNKLIELLNAELRERYVDQDTKFAPHNFLDPNVKTVLIYENNIPIACGAFRENNIESNVEIKRMYTEKSSRSKGFGRKVLAELENWAAELNYKYAILETGDNQPEAIKLYKNMEYEQIPNFPPYENIPESICMRKPLI